MYDITQPSSFDSLENWMKELQRYGSPNPSVVLVGNKVILPYSYYDISSHVFPILTSVHHCIYNMH